MANESAALLQQPRAEKQVGRGRKHGGEVLQHARTSSDVGHPSGLATGLVNVGVALAHQQESKNGVAVVVALDGNERVVVLVGENLDTRGERLRRKMTVELGALHAASLLDDLDAGIVAIDAAAGGIDADDVFLAAIKRGAGDGRKKSQQPAAIGAVDYGRGLMQALLQEIDVEDAVAGGEETTFRVFGIFLGGAIAKVGAYLAAKGDLRAASRPCFCMSSSSCSVKLTISTARR